MTSRNPTRRLTLRQLLTHTDKCARDLHEQLYTSFLSQLSDFRDLSRPVRRRSHYPTLLALQNALRKLQEASTEATSLAAYLHEHLQEIREHARRERVNRL